MTADASLSATAAANRARQRVTNDKIRMVEQALHQMTRDHLPITYPAVARRAGVSRSFLYENPLAKARVQEAVSAAAQQRQKRQADHDVQVEASWRQRAVNAEDALKDAFKVIDAHRDQIGQLLGRIRDLEGHYDEETVQRIRADSTALKHRIRELTADNRGLEEKLKAARSNNRFLDRRIADLEAALLEATSGQ